LGRPRLRDPAPRSPLAKINPGQIGTGAHVPRFVPPELGPPGTDLPWAIALEIGSRKPSGRPAVDPGFQHIGKEGGISNAWGEAPARPLPENWGGRRWKNRPHFPGAQKLGGRAPRTFGPRTSPVGGDQPAPRTRSHGGPPTASRRTEDPARRPPRGFPNPAGLLPRPLPSEVPRVGTPPT